MAKWGQGAGAGALPTDDYSSAESQGVRAGAVVGRARHRDLWDRLWSPGRGGGPAEARGLLQREAQPTTSALPAQTCSIGAGGDRGAGLWGLWDTVPADPRARPEADCLPRVSQLDCLTSRYLQRQAMRWRWDSNPAPGCFAVPGRDGERPLTCDADSPTLTARARRGPAVPDAVRTQHGPGRRPTASLGSTRGPLRLRLLMQLSRPGHRPWLTVADRSGPMVRARRGHGRRGQTWLRRGTTVTSLTAGHKCRGWSMFKGGQQCASLGLRG